MENATTETISSSAIGIPISSSSLVCQASIFGSGFVIQFGSPNGQSTFRSIVLSLPGFNISLNATYQNGDTDDYYSVWDPQSILNFTCMRK